MPRAKKTSKPSTSTKKQKSGVTIRMYNCGFGDCFLLTFHAQDGSPRYVAIDCGVHHQYQEKKFENPQERMQKIAENIADYTGKHLHIVAVTHEHTDHTLGFRYAKDIFEKIQVDDLWLSWAENSEDEVTKTFKKSIKKSVEELTSSLNSLKQIDDELAANIYGLMGFEVELGAAAPKETELNFLRRLREKVNTTTLQYHEPGQDPLTIPGVSGVKVHVLGPPKDPKKIKDLREGNELYPEFAAISEFRSFAMALESRLKTASGGDESGVKQDLPFDMGYVIDPQNVKTETKYQDFFREHYGFSNEKGQEEEWRRIDDDWLATTGEELALKIGNYTNNTSLVLAFELTDTQPHKFLLFAADAQSSNWLSWYDKDKVKVDVENLLRNTVFYKTGHHCSRNATLREKGLELMNDPGLVAMIPVDQKWANDKMDWEHPAPKLLKSLEEKTKNRVLRSDRISSMPDILQKPDTLTKKEWDTFLNSVEWDHSPDKLWIQYTVEG